MRMTSRRKELLNRLERCLASGIGYRFDSRYRVTYHNRKGESKFALLERREDGSHCIGFYSAMEVLEIVEGEREPEGAVA